MTIHYVVQTELTNLTIIGTSIVQAAIDLTVVNTSLSILTLTVDKVEHRATEHHDRIQS